MFLTANNNSVPDFLRALGFIAPEGSTLESIISKEEIPAKTEAAVPPSIEVRAPTNIDYTKKDLSSTFSFSDPNTDKQVSLTVDFPRHISGAAKEDYTQPETERSYKMSEGKKMKISEWQMTDGVGYVIKEAYSGFPANTMFFYREGDDEQ